MTFDTEKFIREIESRKAIWDISCEEYSNRDVKKRRWEEITNIMCEENATENEKKELGKSLQQKWKNIRTSFSRELKRREGAKSGSASSRKSPYVYFDQLQFLRVTVVNNATEASMDETKIAENNDEGSSIQKQPLPKKKKKAEDEMLIDVLKQSIRMREDREKNQEYNSDRLFLLSLLEDFKKIPEYRRLSTKLELINVIKKAQMASSEYDRGYSDSGRASSVGGLYRRRYTTQPGYESETSGNRQYRHGYSTQPDYVPEALDRQHRYGYSTQPDYGLEASDAGLSNRYSMPSVDTQDTTTGYVQVLSPTDTTSSDMSQNSSIIDLFQETVHEL